MSNNADLAGEVRGVAEAVGELAWELPVWDEVYKKELKSTVADMKNTGGRFGGAITGAMFIKRFRQGCALAAPRHRRPGDGQRRRSVHAQGWDRLWGPHAGRASPPARCHVTGLSVGMTLGTWQCPFRVDGTRRRCSAAPYS